MDFLNSFLNLVVPPASLVMLAFAWPTLCFIYACEWIYAQFCVDQSMEDKVVIITGASSSLGEQIAYEYAKRGATLVLVARRYTRLYAISENARRIGATHVMIVAADVVKEEDCRRFINETVSFYGRVDHLVNATSLGHTFYFEEATDPSMFPHLMDINFWGNVYPTYVALPYLRQTRGRIVVNASVENWFPLPRMSLYSAAKSALVNFYETLRLEVNEDVGITIATHGWVGAELTKGKFMIDNGTDMQWREEREVHVPSSPIEEFSKLIVSGACKGDPYVKYPSWYDVFLLFRAFAPRILGWTFRLLLVPKNERRMSLVGVGRPLIETSAPKGPSSQMTSSRATYAQQLIKAD
ncbi:hypothetical protein vseg_011586 [Gypsophila vaccaria]